MGSVGIDSIRAAAAGPAEAMTTSVANQTAPRNSVGRELLRTMYQNGEPLTGKSKRAVDQSPKSISGAVAMSARRNASPASQIEATMVMRASRLVLSVADLPVFGLNTRNYSRVPAYATPRGAYVARRPRRPGISLAPYRPGAAACPIL
jgi:hypothetical protein